MKELLTTMLKAKIVRNLLMKILISLSILILVGHLIVSYLPFSWGSPQLNSKLAFIKSQNLDPDIYFLGSSITNRQLMPSIFDSITSQGFESFNLAVDGTMPPHHFYLVENLVKVDTSIEYIFMELDGFDHMPPKHYRTTFSKFYFSPRWYWWSMLNLANSSSIKLEQKAAMAVKYTRTVFENIFKVGMRLDILKSYTQGNKYSFKVLKRHGNGFMYFNTLYTENKEQKRVKEKVLSNTKQNFTKALTKTKQGESLQSNGVYKHLLKKYIKHCNELGVKLIYVINPRHSVLLSAEELYDIKSEIGEQNMIDISDPVKYKQLYNSKVRYDADHLNRKGARMYSEIFANLFVDIKNKTD